MVYNRARRGDAPREPANACDAPVQLPETRVGAHFALSGREVRGTLGRAISGLVDGWEGGA